MKNNSITKILLALLFCCPLLFVNAQSSGSITTKIFDESSEPLEFSTNVLYRAQDSSMVKIAISEPNGSIVFNDIPFQRYYMHTSFVGFKDVYTNFVHKTNATEIPAIQLKSGNILEEVEIKSRRRFIKREIDRVVLNVNATMNADGGSLAEVLQVAPGVNLGANGNISLRGKSGVIVLIDGRRSYLQGSDLENFISGIPANQFSNIEIMTNPPAKYEAEGNAGIINIITKKNYQKGWELNLNSSYRQGKYATIANSIGLNINSKKISFFSNVSYTNRNDFEDYYIVRKFYDTNDNLLSVFDQNTFMKRRNNLLTARLGLDYFINEQTTIGFSITPQVTIGDTNISNLTSLLDATNTVNTTLIGPAVYDADYRNFKSNIHLSHKLDENGQNISADLDYLKFKSEVEQSFQNSYFDTSDNLTENEKLLNILPQDISIFTAKVDYTLPLSEVSKLELGAKIGFVKSDNDAKFYEQVGNELVLNTSLSNYFKYDENVNAGYVNYTQLFGNISFQAGVRVEKTDITGNQVKENVIFTNNYINILPSAFFKYDLGEGEHVGLSYGRRLERPEYKDLNPFRYFYDAYTFEEGNPELTPQFSDNFELSYSLFDGAISTSLYYNKTKDIITEVIFQDDVTNETFIRKENLNNLTTYGANLSIEMPVTEDLAISLNLDYSQNKLKGIVGNDKFSIEANTFSASLLNQYSINNNWKLELAGWYTSESLSDTFVREPFGRVSFGISRKICDGRGKIRLSGNDIFGWTNFNAKSGFPNTDLTVKNTWQTKTLMLAFTYRLGSGYNKKTKDRETGSEQENNRLEQYQE
ncbi:outer membrane beta-barrel family protein [Tenacibaculum ovolyticum]|uniref:outer membrane beta-barrel family protein n=1 Tax=Tenacibaculum ovolyticum TaxID=104270 RepID=UPI00040CF3FD|nr:outer membrane beta-barrel family protein [Tenacibaculum ovolyticum]